METVMSKHTAHMEFCWNGVYDKKKAQSPVWHMV